LVAPPASSLALRFVLKAAVHHNAVRGGADESAAFVAYHEGSRDQAIVAAMWTIGFDDADPYGGGHDELLDAVEELVTCPEHQHDKFHWDGFDGITICPRVYAVIDLLTRMSTWSGTDGT
jgi:hypothetical protein